MPAMPEPCESPEPIGVTVNGRSDDWTPEKASPCLLLPLVDWMVVRLAHAAPQSVEALAVSGDGPEEMMKLLIARSQPVGPRRIGIF